MTVRFASLVVLVACGAPARPVDPTSVPHTSPLLAPIAPRRAVAPQPNDVAARVDGKAITFADVDRHIDATVKAAIAAVADPDDRAHRLASERMRELADMIDDRVILAAAGDRVMIPSDEIDRAIASVAAQNQLTHDELVKVLAERGFSERDYRDEVRTQLLLQTLYNREAKVPGEPPADIRKRMLARDRARIPVQIALVVPPAPARVPQSTTVLDISTVIAAADVARTLHRTLPSFTTGRLGDEPGTDTYDSLHFTATGKSETFDLAIRVWQGPAAVIDPAWDSIQALPDIVAGTELGTASVRAHDAQANIFGVGFVDRPASMVVLVTCGSDLCQTADETAAIAGLVRDRLAQMSGRTVK